MLSGLLFIYLSPPAAVGEHLGSTQQQDRNRSAKDRWVLEADLCIAAAAVAAADHPVIDSGVKVVY